MLLAADARGSMIQRSAAKKHWYAPIAMQHLASSQLYKVRKKEIEFMETQQRHKVNRRQAVQILEGKGERRTAMKPMRYERYALVSVQQEQARKVCPFQVENFLVDQFNWKREHVTLKRRGYIIKTTSADHFNKLMKLIKILDATCTTSDNNPILKL